ncbi:MAG: inosine-5-monophosphate dehydrogenase [Hyphomonas sp.]|uniref:CBS domain-containing protein n=1 Tax=Hyphomonas sp. TaxID=87 RepID=UPI001E166593|nr:CBS domain-containing protein [Hyphomonas sp.]MBA4227883.1 inosine-5-monophosphate dehydrogenase [Hyphomonas sp.]
MIIEQILNDKGREVITLRADDTLREAARLLDERRIGAVVTLDADGEIVGVLSERDIVRQFAREGAAALEMNVGNAMTRAVITITAEAPIDQALQLMTDRRIRHLPVVRNNRLTGFVSIGDLVKWKIAETEAEAQAMKSYLSAQF